MKFRTLSVLALASVSLLHANCSSAEPRDGIVWEKTIAREEGRQCSWPSVAKAADGSLIVVFSGDREAHICPWGKVQMVKSRDGGETWSEPRTIGKTRLDDRDAGIVALPDGRLFVAWFNSVAYRKYFDMDATNYPPGTAKAKWQEFDRSMTDAERRENFGFYGIWSSDNGETWTKPEKLVTLRAQTPHGPIILKDGSLLQFGRRFDDNVREMFTPKYWGEHTTITVERSVDGGHIWNTLCDGIPDSTGENDRRKYYFHEPHVAELPNGELFALIRADYAKDVLMRQTRSIDGGRTWEPITPTTLSGLPPHLLVLKDGRLLAAYGRRTKDRGGFGEYASISSDGGRTWDCEIKLSGSTNDDLGYPASVELDDGTILTVYYQPLPTGGKPCIMATKWRLPDIGNAVSAAPRSFTHYNVIPLSAGREATAAADAVELHARTGVNLALYSLTLHPEGVPAIEKAERYVESFRAFKRALSGTPVRAGVLVQSILGHWPRVDKDKEPWTMTVDSAGKNVRFCPMDPGFSNYIARVFTLLAREKPAFIMTDDDVRGYSHKAECFCARHVALFNARRGTSYTADELRARLKAARQDDPDYVAFLALQREMIEGMLRTARSAVDAVDPSIPGGICVAGEEHFLCAPLARAIAAKGQRPVMRTSTGLYAERMSAAGVPNNVCRMMGFEAYYNDSGIDLLCESDTCPHNLWSKSARSFFTHMANAAFVGMTGAKTWYVNVHKGAFAVSRNYTDILAENPRFLSALAAAVEGTDWEGLAIPCFTNFPKWHMMGKHDEFFVENGNAGATVCAAFGLPFYATRNFDDDRVYALASAAEVDRLSDDDLRRIFSRRVLVFRNAALALTKRGLERWTGVAAKETPLLFNREHDNALDVDISYTPSSGSVAFTVLPGAEVLSTLGFRPFAGSPQYDVATPATVLYDNELGGKALTVQYHANMQLLQRHSEGRKASLLAAVNRLAGGSLGAVSAHDQDMLTLVRRAQDGSRLVLAENLNPDPVRELSLFVPHGDVRVERLMGDGTWKSVSARREGQRLVCDVSLAFYEAAVLRLRTGD